MKLQVRKLQGWKLFSVAKYFPPLLYGTVDRVLTPGYIDDIFVEKWW
jgi:hypothetical protein